jgi:glycine/D-amino acid oxidase-like deaminating enzyme
MHVLVVGGGIFGLTAARALLARGHAVTVAEAVLPHPFAESTDISKIVRIDYGADEDYTILGEQALALWRDPARWPAAHCFHETGVAFVARVPLAGFERDSYELLTRRDHRLERLDADAIAARFPAYKPGAFVDGYFNPIGGWAEASNTVLALADDVRRRGGTIRAARIERLVEGPGGAVTGALIDGDIVRADLTVVCAGSWVPVLVPELAPVLRAVGQPVFHLRPRDPALFEAQRFPVFGADISRTGYYGFPVTADGVVKIANHGTGTALAAGDEANRVVSVAQEDALRAMVADSFPALIDAPIVHRRLCVYCDTFDESFWIARHPERSGLAVATGGSGHAFKFAPVIGEVIAAIALGETHSLASKFRWRSELTTPRGTEAARHRG